jgi:hypothetical protein
VQNQAITRGSEPKTAEEFQDKINDWLVEGGLGRFFQSDDNYLSVLAEKAAQLQADEPTFLSEPGDIEKLVKLSLFKTMFYCGKAFVSTSGKLLKEMKMTAPLWRIPL